MRRLVACVVFAAVDSRLDRVAASQTGGALIAGPRPLLVPPAGGAAQPSGFNDANQGALLNWPVETQQPARQEQQVFLQQPQQHDGIALAQVSADAHNLASADVLLKDETMHDSMEVQTILQEIREAQAELARQRRFTKTLEQEVLRQRQGAADCQREVQQLESPKSAQVRRAELLRLRSASANTQAIQARITQTEQEVAAFKRSGNSQLAALRGALNRMHQQADAANSELAAEASGRANVEKEVRRAQRQVKALKAKLAANGMALLVANNTQLKEELQQAQRQLEVSEANVARAALATTRAKDAAFVLRQTAEADSLQAQKIARESLAEVVAVQKEDTALTIRVEAATREARSVVLDSCEAIWDREHPEAVQKLKQCEQTKIDLQTATAELASMSSIMSASGARAAESAV